LDALTPTLTHTETEQKKKRQTNDCRLLLLPTLLSQHIKKLTRADKRPHDGPRDMKPEQHHASPPLTKEPVS
ncbi:hypothetical protein ACVGV7_00120, partial [Enterobacter intestinihominis]